MMSIARFRVPAAFCLAMGAACLPLDAQVPAGYQQYDSLGRQFTIALPNGWLVFDQTEHFRRLGATLQAEGFGLIYFSPVDIAALTAITPTGPTDSAMAIRRRVDTGEVPAFFVDRQPTERSMSCASLTRRGYSRVQDLLRRDGNSGGSHILELVGDSAAVGGCQGARFRQRVRTRNGTEWIADVRVAADGSTLYLFSLRNVAAYFDRNLPTFETAMSTLHLAGAPARP